MLASSRAMARGARPSPCGALALALCFSSSLARADAPAAPAPTSTRWTLGGHDPSGLSRARSLGDLPQLDGASGLLRTQHADGAAAGQLRLQLLGFALRSSWLCDARCPSDSARALSSHGARLALGVGVFSWLEAYGSLGAQSTRADALAPQPLSALGDARLGLKLHTATPLRGLRLGASVQGELPANDGGARSVWRSLGGEFALLATLDGRERDRPLPFRLTLQLGYALDRRAPRQWRGEPAQLAGRAERFAFDLHGSDRLRARLGGELLLWRQRLRPFSEFGVDVPVREQVARCGEAGTDRCLGAAPWPLSRVSFGLRSSQLPAGMTATLALDLGVTGVHRHAQAIVPEAPWRLWFGLGWNVEPRPPQPARIVTTTTSEDGQGVLSGVVLDAQTRAPLPQAVLEFLSETSQSALASADDGRFFSDGLRPGAQRLRVSKPGYFSAECTVLAQVPAAGDAPLGECRLRVKPRASSVHLQLLADQDQPLARAEVRVLQDGEVQLGVSDEAGRVHFERLPAGDIELAVRAEGHLPLRLGLQLAPGASPSLRLRPIVRAAEAPFERRGDTLRVREPLPWRAPSAQVPHALEPLLRELAEWLRDHPELRRLELQWQRIAPHRLPAERALHEAHAQAEQLRSWLVRQGGVAAERLSARALPRAPHAGPDRAPRAARSGGWLQLQILEQIQLPAAAAAPTSTTTEPAGP